MATQFYTNPNLQGSPIALRNYGGRNSFLQLFFTKEEEPELAGETFYGDDGSICYNMFQLKASAGGWKYDTDGAKVARELDLATTRDEIAKRGPEWEKAVQLRKSAFGRFILSKSVDKAASQANTDPTEGQIESGCYKKGKVKLSGLDIMIENPKGSTRSGKNDDGTEWSIKMKNHYGYIKRTEGKDGDEVDVVIVPGTDDGYDGPVFIVNQDNDKGTFDEHKCIIGASTKAEARKTYVEGYERGWSDHIRSIKRMTMEEFKEWVYDGKKKREAQGKQPCSKCGSVERQGTRGADPREWTCPNCRSIWLGETGEPARYTNNPALTKGQQAELQAWIDDGRKRQAQAQRISTGWLDPRGKYYPTSYTKTHGMFAAKILGHQYEKDKEWDYTLDLLKQGWVRLVKDGNFLEVEGQLNKTQKDLLITYCINKELWLGDAERYGNHPPYNNGGDEEGVIYRPYQENQ